MRVTSDVRPAWYFHDGVMSLHARGCHTRPCATRCAPGCSAHSGRLSARPRCALAALLARAFRRASRRASHPAPRRRRCCRQRHHLDCSKAPAYPGTGSRDLLRFAACKRIQDRALLQAETVDGSARVVPSKALSYPRRCKTSTRRRGAATRICIATLPRPRVVSGNQAKADLNCGGKR